MIDHTTTKHGLSGECQVVSFAAQAKFELSVKTRHLVFYFIYLFFKS